MAAPTPLDAPLPKGIPLDPQDIQPLSTTCWAWRKLNIMLGDVPLYSSAIPLSNNTFLPLTSEKVVQHTHTKLGLDTLGSLFPEGHARTLMELSALPGMTYMDNFITARLLGALPSTVAFFPSPPTDFTPLTLLITDKEGIHLFTKLYKACIALKQVRDRGVRQRWEEDLGHSLTDKEWTFCLDQIQKISPNHRHKLLHFKLIHRIYVTKRQLANLTPPNRPTAPNAEHKMPTLLTWPGHVPRSCRTGWRYFKQ